MRTSELLHKAGDLLEKPGAWTRSVYARDKLGGSIWPTDKAATCWCALGAIIKFGDGYGRVEAVEYLQSVLHSRDIAHWNDVSGRTKEEIVAVFRQAEQLALDAEIRKQNDAIQSQHSAG